MSPRTLHNVLLLVACCLFLTTLAHALSPHERLLIQAAGKFHPSLSSDPAVRNSFLWREFFGRVVGAHPDAATSVESNGGGTTCVTCTLLLSIVEQYAQIHELAIDKTLDELCMKLPDALRLPCKVAVKHYSPIIINGMENNDNPDVLCRKMKLCTDPTCHLYPIPDTTMINDVDDIGPMPYVEFPLHGGVGQHLPEVDLDSDYFSTAETLRGADWRGKDCDDTEKDIYPGRKTTNFPAERDHDCNGIYGVNPLTGKTYEEELCASTPRYGIAVLGDSASAHFHIPRSYMNVSEIDDTTYRSLPLIGENEFDWPQMSQVTGHTITDWIGTPGAPVSSYYLSSIEQNRCGHRDYQNLGVNGARASAMKDTIMYTLKRNSETDYPLMLVYALIGNDVCNSHPGTSSMTTPQEFYSDVTDALEYLDTIVPAGSHLLFYGLVDGRILWNSMNDLIHPIGATNKNVKYSDVYEFLNCLDISPCRGWLNSNETLRNETTQRANELNQVYLDIIANQSYANFDMTYFPTPMAEAISIWNAHGGQNWELIEPIDGFHPDQYTNVLFSEINWGKFTTNYTYLVPPANPNNDKIAKFFGDQGGY